MDQKQKTDILNKASLFFKNSIASNHAKNIKKSSSLEEYNINPFLVHYISNLAFGDEKPASLAKTLLYPRILGTSIATSFGSNIQNFCHKVLDGFPSTTSGIDIEFNNSQTGRHTYCQLKAGPQTINKDDVTTIKNHFQKLANLARTNGNMDFNPNTDCCVGILYGDHSQISANYKKIEEDYMILSGPEFWLALTGDENFYLNLIDVFSQCAKEYSDNNLINNAIEELAIDIENHPEILKYETIEI